MIYKLELPLPPSANRYWRHVPVPHKKGVVVVKISEEGRKYAELVARAVVDSGIKTITGAIALKGIWYCPDMRRRDIDNIRKPLYDACTKAGLWEDDSMIIYDPILKKLAPDGEEGKVVLTITQVASAILRKAGAWSK